MRTLVLADVHANALALEAVLADAAGQWDRAVFLGDAIGYGPRPNEACARLRSLSGLVAVRGNHDRAVVGNLETSRFSRAARSSLAWTAMRLGPAEREWLASLPAGPVETADGLVLAHGSPADEDAYLFTADAAAELGGAAAGRLVLFGHTHVATAYRARGDGVVERVGAAGLLTLGDDGWLLNPGAVGQPRDGRPEAAYALLDASTRRIDFRRAAYDAEAVRAELRGAGLPSSLGDRLLTGS